MVTFYVEASDLTCQGKIALCYYIGDSWADSSKFIVSYDIINLTGYHLFLEPICSETYEATEGVYHNYNPATVIDDLEARFRVSLFSRKKTRSILLMRFQTP